MKLFYSKQFKIVIDVLNPETGKGYVHEESLDQINGVSQYSYRLLTFDEVVQDLKQTGQLVQWTDEQFEEYVQRDYNAIVVSGFYFDNQYNHRIRTNEMVISFKDEHYYVANKEQSND